MPDWFRLKIYTVFSDSNPAKSPGKEEREDCPHSNGGSAFRTPRQEASNDHSCGKHRSYAHRNRAGNELTAMLAFLGVSKDFFSAKRTLSESLTGCGSNSRCHNVLSCAKLVLFQSLELGLAPEKVT